MVAVAQPNRDSADFHHPPARRGVLLPRFRYRTPTTALSFRSAVGVSGAVRDLEPIDRLPGQSDQPHHLEMAEADIQGGSQGELSSGLARVLTCSNGILTAAASVTLCKVGQHIDHESYDCGDKEK